MPDKTTYVPGQSFEDFFYANGFEQNTQGYIEARIAYKQSKANHEKYGATAEAYNGFSSGGTSSSGNVGIQALLNRLSSPLYGLDFYERLIAASTPSYADYAARVAALGGSHKQAREQQEAAAQRIRGQGFDAWKAFTYNKDATLLGTTLGLYNSNLQNQQYQQSRRDSIWNSLLGAAANLAGMYVGSKLFGTDDAEQGDYRNPYGGYYGRSSQATPQRPSAAVLGSQQNTRTPGYPVPGANWGGTQQAGMQRMDRPSGPSYDYFGY